MKKLLGISLIAVLTAAPAFAVDVNKDPVHNDTNFATTTQVPKYEAAVSTANDDFMASAGYVKGAYNAAIKAVNQTYDTLSNDIATETTNRKDADDAIKTNVIGAVNDKVSYRATNGTVQEALTAVKDEFDTLNTTMSNTYADRNLSNINPAGQTVIDNRVVAKATDGTFAATNEGTSLTANTLGTAINELEANYKAADTALGNRVTINENAITILNGDATTEGSVAKAVKDASDALDTRVTANENAIETLNGDATTEGSVAKAVADAVSTEATLRENADNAIKTDVIGAGTNGKVTFGEDTNLTVQGALNAVETKIGNLQSDNAGTYAKKPNVQATIAESSVKVMTEWGKDTVSKRYIDAAEYTETVPSTKNGGIEAIED